MAKKNVDNSILIGVQIIDYFREMTGYSMDKFLDYMNKNNIWDEMKDIDVIGGFMWAEIDDIVDFLGRGLTEDERLEIISRHNSRLPHS